MTRVLDERTIQINFPSEVGYERVAMECSAAFAKMAGFLPERIEDLRTVVSEACLNAIEHGNKGRAYARVIMTVHHGDGGFSVTVLDEGEGINELPKEPDIQKQIEKLEEPNGWGLFLIQQLADQVELNEMTKEGHSIRMIMKMTK